MKTTIDNNQRVFVINYNGFFTQKFFCNLSDIPQILIDHLQKGDSFTIYEYWNGKLQKCSKKFLNEMFEANNINFKVG